MQHGDDVEAYAAWCDRYGGKLLAGVLLLAAVVVLVAGR